jgi:hypothetical protein
VRRAVFIGPVGEQVLAVVVVDRRAQKALRCGDAPTRVLRLLPKPRVLLGLFGPDAAPVVPAFDPGFQAFQIVRVDAGRDVARREVGEDEIDLRIAGA